MKGNFPHFVVLGFLILRIQNLSFAQSDTVVLQTVDVSEVVECQFKEFTSLNFDSSQYNSNVLDAGEFLTSQSSVYVKDYGPGSTSSLSYRGNSAYHTKVYWEGMSIDNVMLGQSDLSLISFGNGTKASFLKGGHSIGMSSGGFGGVLNVETGNELWKGVGVSAGAEYGSFNSRRIPLSIFMGNGKWKLEAFVNVASSANDYPYVNYLDKDEIEYRENAAFERVQVVPKLSFKANNHHTFSLSYWYTHSERQVPSAIEVKHGDAFQVDLWNKALFNYQFKRNKWLVNLKTTYAQDHLNYTNKNLMIESLSQTDAFRNMVSIGKSLNARIKLESQLRYDLIKVQSNNYKYVENQNIISFYQALNYHKKNYFLKPGVRIENQSGRSTYFLPSIDAGFSPFDFKKPLWIYISYSRNVRFPSFNEQFWLNSGNPDLKEEVANSFDLGFDQVLMNKSNSIFSIQSTLFYSEVQNLIVWSPSNASIWIPQNLKTVLNQGLEFEGKYFLKLKNWTLDGRIAYTYVSSIVSEDDIIAENEGNQQLYIPKHKSYGNLSVSYKTYFISYNQTYTDEVFTTNDNSTTIPFNSPANAEIGKNFHFKNTQLTLSFSVKNLFDESYQYVLHQPMPMRHYFINIQFNFNKYN